MCQSMHFLALVASVASAAKIQGFNYGSTDSTGAIRDQANFEVAFKTAKNLVGTDNAFTSARLYSMIQGGTSGDVTAAIPAAIAQDTTLMLGLWTSGDAWEKELAALTTAIKTYGSSFTNLVTAISVGSEDLYRNSPDGIAAKSYMGEQPDVLVEHIKAVRTVIAGTPLSTVGVGHVDTWTAWVNGSNADVLANVDWLGFDSYPYWQLADNNAAKNGKALFMDSFNKVLAVAASKEVWVTETGWAVSDDKGKGKEHLAVASPDDAKVFWDDVGCGYLFGNINTYWYTLSEAGASPNFGVSSSDTSTTPLYDLSCSNNSAVSASSTTSSATSAPSTISSGTSSGANASYSDRPSSSPSSSNSSVSVSSLSRPSATSNGATTSSAGGSKSSTTASSNSASVSPSSTNKSSAVANVVSAAGLLAAGIMALFLAL